MSSEARSAATRPDRPLLASLRNLEAGYDRKFALGYCADDVWAVLEASAALIEAWGHHAPGQPELVEAEDALIDAMGLSA